MHLVSDSKHGCLSTASVLLGCKDVDVNVARKVRMAISLCCYIHISLNHCGELFLIIKIVGNAHQDDGATPLYLASKCNNMEMTSLLLKHGASLHSTVASVRQAPSCNTWGIGNTFEFEFEFKCMMNH